MLNQNQAPIYEGLVKLRKKRIVPFDVPGHKRGRGNPELVELLGEKCVGIDVNSMKPLDNLGHPISIIREAEELAAEAFGAAPAGQASVAGAQAPFPPQQNAEGESADDLPF